MSFWIAGFWVDGFWAPSFWGSGTAPSDQVSGGNAKRRRLYIPASKKFKAVLEGSESVLVELEARTEQAAWEVEKAVPDKGKKQFKDEKDISIILALLS